jgi:hypothetical protein
MMQAVTQTTEDLLSRLSPLEIEWRDETADAAIAKLAALEIKATYGRDDIAQLLSGDFGVGILCARLFMGLSKDRMEQELRNALGPGGIGSMRFKSDSDGFLDAMCALGLHQRMSQAVNYQPSWSDILVERLRSGRGSAIQGQRRGRHLEDLVEALVREVFGDDGYQPRCTFVGTKGRSAKCDFVIPTKNDAQIIIEVKGYGATGSKMSDVIGDLDAIIEAKRSDSRLLFVTDGTPWFLRQSDLRKIVQRQNDGDIMRIYTSSMHAELVADLRTLKQESGL